MSRLPALIYSLLFVFAMPSAAGDKVEYKIKHDPFFKKQESRRVIGQTRQKPAIPKPVKWDVTLHGIILAGESSMANVDGHIIGLGETYQGFRLIFVEKDSAFFEKDGHKYILSLVKNEQ